jgi:hypothetical protein
VVYAPLKATLSRRACSVEIDDSEYLLRRAAEITLQAGYAYFSFDTRSMEATTYYRTIFDT